MKAAAFLAALLIGTPVAATMVAFAPQDADIRELARLDDAWAAAETKHAGAAVAPMLAEDFVLTGADGQTHSKSEYVKTITADTTQLVSGVGSERKIRVRGVTAVLTGLWTQTVNTVRGPEVQRYRWTTTWIKERDGRWMCFAELTFLLAK